MRVALALLPLALGAVAAASVVVAVGGSVDGFVVGVAIWTFAPFALLAAISRLISILGLLLTLLALAAAQWLAVAEFLGSSDGQAGLIFLFLPFWMIVGVLAGWGLDALVRLVGRTFRQRSA